jgi:hypothetical protein
LKTDQSSIINCSDAAAAPGCSLGACCSCEYETSKHCFINEIVDNALFATQIPLSIFTDVSLQRFDKHSMLESTVEILQQFYNQIEPEPDEFAIFPGDLST